MTTDPTHFDEDYYRANGQLGDRPALRYYVRLVQRYVGPGPYLDFGCGTGHLVRRLAGAGEAAGFEISEYSAEQARRTAPGCVVYTKTDDIPDGYFGGITSVHVLEHLSDEIAEEVVATFRRILKPDGKALVVMPDPMGRGRRLKGDTWNGFADETHINLKPHAEWRKFLTDRGMRVLREGSDGLWDVPYRKLPKLVDAAVHAGPSLAQFLSGRLVLGPGSGESSIFVLAKA
ncbi:class I SAM-dependent methyltransferase [Saccharothrix obliqua]|uniref:class I SAM-dependent methyltransferase n=1 Tax=Saccharothrix obliqua TaxID=2861747 RepID=UPI001C5F9895|nr:class I SAM-dependent methyltransferase [Saccharothrix obliqua]MBW4720779.1 class I SAM-dependent methyltransferase [Saccharothrix obliqua]